MLYGLFHMDLVYGVFRINFDVMVWQWEVNMSDYERCQTLHIAAVWCLLDA